MNGAVRTNPVANPAGRARTLSPIVVKLDRMISDLVELTRQLKIATRARNHAQLTTFAALGKNLHEGFDHCSLRRQLCLNSLFWRWRNVVLKNILQQSIMTVLIQRKDVE